MKLKNIRTGKEVTVHTDRMRVIPEESITVRENERVRKAYPLQESNYEELTYPDYIQDEEIQRQKGIENRGETENQRETEKQGEIDTPEEIGAEETAPEQKRDRETVQEGPDDEQIKQESEDSYNLRSRGRAPELSHIMPSPLEYERN